MATLRLTLLISFLLGLALLTAPRDADGALVRGTVTILHCRTEYMACASYRQRCAECVAICKKAQTSPMPVSATSAMLYCKQLV